MKKDLLVILLSCFLGLTFASCDDSSEPENGGEVEQTAPAWAIGVWETVSDVAEVYQKEFEITESSFHEIRYTKTLDGELQLVETPIYVFGKEQTIKTILYNGSTEEYIAKLMVTKRTDKEFVYDSYVNGENLGPHFGLEKDGDKFYYRDWDSENDKMWGLTKERWEVVKKQ